MFTSHLVWIYLIKHWHIKHIMKVNKYRQIIFHQSLAPSQYQVMHSLESIQIFFFLKFIRLILTHAILGWRPLFYSLCDWYIVQQPSSCYLNMNCFSFRCLCSLLRKHKNRNCSYLLFMIFIVFAKIISF